jgi:type I restriction enzyme S subunit
MSQPKRQCQRAPVAASRQSAANSQNEAEVQPPATNPAGRWPLPKSWVWVRANQIARIVGGGTPPSGDARNFCAPGRGHPWVTPADLTGYEAATIAHGRRNLTQRGMDNCGTQELPKDTVLLSSRAPVGYCAVAANPISTNQGFKSFVLAGGVSPLYVRYYFKASKDYLHTFASGTTFPEISGKKAGEIAIPLPPLAEQRRIVARLEQLEARSRHARAALADVPALLAQARQSLLAAAFRGDLTKDWRKDRPKLQPGSSLVSVLEAAHRDAGGHKRGNAAQATEGVHDLTPADFPASWGLTDLLNLCRPGKPVTYGILMPGPDQPGGVPYVRVADFPGEVINLQTVRRTTKEMDASFARSRLSAGDLLLSIRGSVGRLAIVPPELNGANITQDSVRLSIKEEVETAFVEYMLRAPATLARMQKATKGVAVRGINVGDVRALQIPIPALAEQREIVRRLERALARLDAATAAHAAAVAELDRLDQSLLARAFRGELVPQIHP